MHSPELAEIVHRAERLLWIIARSDVENLSASRPSLLRQLDELERRAAFSHHPDLYREVLQSASLER
jgi:hypothetical protein